MPYRYQFDNTIIGHFTPDRDLYGLMTEGLVALKQEADIWNRTVVASGAQAPYAQESEDLQRMIEFGKNKLADNDANSISIGQISVGSIRYFKAGLELILYRKRNDLTKNRTAGWPSGALDSLKKSIEQYELIARRFNYPPADILWEVLGVQDSDKISEQVRSNETLLWDAFISHASEDKADFVHPLAEKLKAANLRIWYDDWSLKVGDSLRRSIDKGLSTARYGVVVLSPSFFAKEWPQRELDGLVAREVNGQRVILPVWLNVSVNDVRRYSPTLADRVAARSEDGLESVVVGLLKALKA